MGDTREVLTRWLEIENGNQVRVALISGAPGVGKTYFTETFAKRHNAEYLYYLCHNWTSDEELFIGVNVGKAVVGTSDEQEVYQDGVLLKATKLSQKGLVVVCFDEIDKAPQRAETLLLDFLQHGRVYLPNHEKVMANLRNLVVFLTTNDERPLLEATLRRCFRAKFDFLPVAVEKQIIRQKTGLSAGAIQVILEIAGAIRRAGTSAPSLHEMVLLAHSLRQGVARDVVEVELLIDAFLIKSPADEDALKRAFRNKRQIASVLWGEVVRRNS